MSGLSAPLLPLAQYGGPGQGMGYGMGGGGMYMPFGGLFMVVLLVVGVVLVLMILRRASSGGPKRDDRSSMELLNDRYARGEIDREAYLLMKRDLEGKGEE